MRMVGTTFNDRELETWSAIRRADEQHAFWKASSTSAPVAITALAGETLELRRLWREMIARYEPTTKDLLVLRAVDLLGMNLTTEQPLFQEWPKSSDSARPSIPEREWARRERAGIVAWLRTGPLCGPAETIYADAIEAADDSQFSFNEKT